MELKTLNSLQDIEINISLIEEEIEEANNYLKAVNIDNVGGGRSNIPSDPTESIVIRIVDLQEKLKKELDKKYKVRRNIYNFLDEIDDEEARSILRLKFIKGFSLRKIGELKKYDYTTIKRRLDTYYERYEIV